MDQFDGVIKEDLTGTAGDLYDYPAGWFGGETVFAPRDGSTAEDDGYLLTFCNNLETGKSECAIFDAADITKGPVCRVILPHNIPTGAHAFWAPERMLKH